MNLRPQSTVTLIFVLVWWYGIGLSAQSHGYQHWEQVQGTELHLKAPFLQKTVTQSTTGKDWVPLQIQTYNAEGRLVRDQYYSEYPTLLYDLQFAYAANHTAEGTNALDSSQVTYSFTEEGLLRYYVVDRINDIHMVYTYNEHQRLISVKDCMAPFGNHFWCGYYTYQYNEQGQLSRIQSYNLKSGAPLDSLELFSIDSMVYNDQQQLIERWTLDTAHQPRQHAFYRYNAKGQRTADQGRQLTEAPVLSYIKTYRYRCNGTLRHKTETYYRDEVLQGRQESRYNGKGWLIQQQSFRQGKTPTLWYRMHYQ